MSDTTVDPTLDRLLRHMSWANATMFEWLSRLSEEALGLSSPRNEWTASMILAHLVDSAGGYASRLEGVPRQVRIEPPTTIAGLAELAASCAAFDARLRSQAAVPDGPSPSPNPANPTRARSSIAPRSPALSPRTGSTRSILTSSTCGPTPTRRFLERSLD